MRRCRRASALACPAESTLLTAVILLLRAPVLFLPPPAPFANSETKWQKREVASAAAAGTIGAAANVRPMPAALLQRDQGLVEAGERDWNADAGLLRLKDNEDGGLTRLQLFDQRIFQHHLSVAGEGMAAHERRVPDILVVDLEAQARRQQHAERRKHAQHP